MGNLARPWKAQLVELRTVEMDNLLKMTVLECWGLVIEPDIRHGNCVAFSHCTIKCHTLVVCAQQLAW